MRNTKPYIDLGTMFDEIFEAAQHFTKEFHRSFDGFDAGDEDARAHTFERGRPFEAHTDYYPNYSYPPMNVFMTENRSLIFEFAIAGFDEHDISLSFQGDYMVFSATLSDASFADSAAQDTKMRFFKRRLKMKNIEKQKYFVPLDKYAQEQVKAVFKNGILRVTVPPKAEQDVNNGVKIEIVKEGE